MKKYFVIGNPIEHSLSPKLHNYWLNQNKIEAIYDKKLITKNDLEGICNEIRKGNINGLNVTVPFKKEIIPFLDQLSKEAEETQSVNTIYMKNMSNNELEHYLSKITDEALYAYNVYQIEGEGRKLFLEIHGDENTIMGLPIKKIKEYLSNYK